MDALKVLEGVLSEEQFSALTHSVTQMIDAKAEAKATKIVEEQTEQIRAIALQAGQKYYDDKLAQMQATYAGIAEEEVNKVRQEFAGQLQAIETGLVRGIAQVVEESVEQAIPSDIAETIASARAVIGLVEESKQVFERHYVSLDLSGQSKITELAEKVSVAEESYQQAVQTAEALRKENMTLKARSIIDSACIKHGLAEEARQAVYTMMNGKSLSAIETTIESAVSVVEESFVGNKPKAEPVKEDTTQIDSTQQTLTRATGVVEEGVNTSTQGIKPQVEQTKNSTTSVDSFL